MTVVAIYNLKGGVGKTASAVNLSWLAANDSARVLLWDMDPQGAASFYFRVKPRVKGGIEKLLNDKQRVVRSIKATDYDNLHLLPADMSYRNLDLTLDGRKKPMAGVSKVLKPLRDSYDYVFLDCSPNISLVSENVFRSADVLLIPMIPTTLSVRTLNQLVEFLIANDLTHVKFLPFFTMVDRRRKLHVETITSFMKAHPYVMQNYIPYSAAVEKMGIERRVLAEFAPKSPGMVGYRGLWSEIKARLGLGRRVPEQS